MSIYEITTALQLIFIALLLACILTQRITLNRYKHRITQNMIALKQAQKLITNSATARAKVIQEGKWKI
jgi:hypothetical protein